MKVWKSVGLGQIIYIPSGTAIAIRSGIDTKSPPQWPHFGQRLKCQSGKQWVKHVWNMRILVKETESSKTSTVLPLPTPGTWHIIKDISIKSNELKAKFLDSSMWSRTHIGKELKTFKCLRFELKVYAPPKDVLIWTSGKSNLGWEQSQVTSRAPGGTSDKKLCRHKG
jgi:hypothetical protein